MRFPAIRIVICYRQALRGNESTDVLRLPRVPRVPRVPSVSSPRLVFKNWLSEPSCQPLKMLKQWVHFDGRKLHFTETFQGEDGSNKIPPRSCSNSGWEPSSQPRVIPSAIVSGARSPREKTHGIESAPNFCELICCMKDCSLARPCKRTGARWM